jgi:hypothetical protein
MSEQEHIQKKPLATDLEQSEHKGFATRGFAKQIEQDLASMPPQDIKTQIDRAERFGHNLSKMPAPTSSPTAALQTKSSVSGGDRAIQRAEPEEDDELQMKSASPAQSTQNQPLQRKPSTGSGRVIPEPVREKMEKSFGTSFSNVSIHTESAQAKNIGALAYAQGSQIHFAPGQYNPNSTSGQALLGHELTHIVQQRVGRVPTPKQSKGLPINANPALEREADLLGARAAGGRQVQVPGMTNRNALPIQHSTEPVRDSGSSMLKEIGSTDNSSMDLDAYKSLNQHVESLLPKLQQQVMQQPIPGSMQNAMQLDKGGGGKKGGGKKGKGK